MQKNLKIYIGYDVKIFMKKIESIIGDEKLQKYYDSENINGAIKELSYFYELEEFEKLKNYIEKKAVIETYKQEENEKTEKKDN